MRDEGSQAVLMHGHNVACCFSSVLLAGNQQLDVPLLARTVQSVLAQAAAKGMQSVAMPLIGAGLAGWPPKLAAQVHVAQVLKFMGSTGLSLKVIEPVDRHLMPVFRKRLYMQWLNPAWMMTLGLYRLQDLGVVETAGSRVCTDCRISEAAGSRVCRWCRMDP